ncbi:MerR family DNA-binding transcriptional regulator [Xenophilus sp. Marseille-Q4582]|uniref:MerR family DNA-binding transcriptional regulator n=1 Tax=Xenophilus sp. Marseille-Q4582 TaxID=2866600 RepID=UPI001CE3D57D|nr:MerR family DNA-binding transcriptional regulator [Xenophilus sp. Marseille-Q4582]
MNISQLAQRTGVSVHRLRRYEAAGLIHAERSAAGYRDFADRVVREVTFIAMGRALDVPLPVLAELLPRYRAGTLRLDQLADRLRERVAQVDAAIAAQRALRRRLVEHIAWCERRQRAAAPGRSPSSSSSSSPSSSSRKDRTP